MSLKSKIPQGRSKIPFLSSSSKLPTRSKSSPSLKKHLSPVINRTHTNTFIDNNPHSASPLVIESTVDCNANENHCFQHINNIDNHPLDSEENCEILSVSSADPSPSKNYYDSESIDNFDKNLNENLIENQVAPDLLAFQRFQEVLHRSKSPTFSEQSSQSETNLEVQPSSKLPLPPFRAINKKRSGLVKRTKISPGLNKTKLSPNSYSADKPGSSSGNTSWKERNSVIKQKRAYSKPTFNQSKADSSRMSQVGSGHRRYNATSGSQPLISSAASRKVSGPSRGANGGKWCDDIDSAMNLTRKPSRGHILEENGPSQNASLALTQRSDRKKIYQERKNSIKNEEESYQQNILSKELDLQTFNSESSKTTDEKTKPTKNPRSPKIARPVTRPPRRRHQQNNFQYDHQNNKNEQIEDKTTEKQEELNKNVCENDEFRGNVVSRRASVPVSPEKMFHATRSRQRRRASESHRQIEISGISEESGYMSNNGQPIYDNSASGDNSEVMRKQERLRQNERYRDILENPNVVTFGQWRMSHEGNYAPEQKYGISERRRIRSSTDSDSVSPVRKFQNSLEKSSSDVLTSECSDAVDRLTRSTSVESQNNTKVDGRKIWENEDGNDTCPPSDNDISMSVFDDLPSLNSTAMMADYSIASTTNQSQLNHVDEHIESKQQTTKLPNKVTNGITEHYSQSMEIISKQKRFNDMGSPRSHSSPLRKKAAEDISRINECAASGGDLAQRLDEMLVEYRIVRSALEQLYQCLDDEEQQKRRVERENQLLKLKINDMAKEIERLNLPQEESKNEKSKEQRKPSTTSEYTQTDNSDHKVLYKTELSGMSQDIQEALNDLTTLENLKSKFEDKIKSAEKRLQDVLPVFNTV